MKHNKAQAKYAEFQAKIKATEKPGLIGMAAGLERLQLVNDLNHFRQECLDQGITLLEPCPFCGSYDVGIRSAFNKFIGCLDCNTDGPSKNTEYEAIAAWNTRVS